MEDREISREEAIKRLEEGEPFNELYDPQWEAALALAIKALKAEPVKQERCEFCKDGKTFWGAEIILDNEGNWHNIRYCPICGSKMEEIEEEKTPRLIDANEYYVLVRDIENAPTVDAVPVEWINEWVNNYCDRYEEKLIKRLLWTWSKNGRREDEADRRR